MTKRAKLPQSRHHILVYDEDWELLCSHFHPEGKHPIGPGAAIRELVHIAAQRLRQKIIDTSEAGSQQADLSSAETADTLREGASLDQL